MIDNQAKRSHRFYAVILVLIVLWMSLPGLFSIPVIDRDEARFAQTTVQMIESGDVLDMKFQDETRYKKPSGAYWAQLLPAAIFSNPDAPVIGAHRLPNVLAAIISILATYWAGIVLLGRQGAFLSAATLALSLIFVVETHIAKTDALLCATAAVTLMTLVRILAISPLIKSHRANTALANKYVYTFWGAIGLSVLIKGPVVPGLVILTCVTFYCFKRDLSWAKPLLNPIGIGLFIALTVPWAIAISITTGGAFWGDALGLDFGSKLVSAQESHGGWPGYYLLSLPILFWPGSLILVCALIFAFKVARQNSTENELFINGTLLLLCWAVPFWILLELIPTKLPHYILPIFPAFALMCGAATMGLSVASMKIARQIGAVLFFIVSISLMLFIFGAEAAFSESHNIFVTIVFVAVLALVYWTVYQFWRGKISRALAGSAVTALLISPLAYGFILPNLDDLYVAKNIRAAIADENINLSLRQDTQIYSPTFTEPSLVYYLGRTVRLGDQVPEAPDAVLREKDLLLIDAKSDMGESFIDNLGTRRDDQILCPVELSAVKGMNYSKGDRVDIRLIQYQPCPLLEAEGESLSTDTTQVQSESSVSGTNERE